MCVSDESQENMDEDIHGCDRGVRTSNMQEFMLRKELFHIRNRVNCEGNHERTFPNIPRLQESLLVQLSSIQQ